MFLFTCVPRLLVKKHQLLTLCISQASDNAPKKLFYGMNMPLSENRGAGKVRLLFMGYGLQVMASITLPLAQSLNEFPGHLTVAPVTNEPLIRPL
jgi:hypothetical protein